MKMHWTRIENRLKKTTDDQQKIDSVLKLLRKLVHLYQSKGITHFFFTTEKLVSLGCYLIKNKTPKIIVPCCADFSHVNGIYDFKSLSDGVPVSVTHYVEMIHELKLVFPRIQVKIMISESECIVQGLLQKNLDWSFRRKIRSSCKAIENYLSQTVQSVRMGLLTFIETLLIFSSLWLFKEGEDYVRKRVNRERTLKMTINGLSRIPDSELEHSLKVQAIAAQYIQAVKMAKRQNAILLIHDNYEISLFKRFQELRTTKIPIIGNKRKIY